MVPYDEEIRRLIEKLLWMPQMPFSRKRFFDCFSATKTHLPPNGVLTTNSLDFAISSDQQNVIVAGDFSSHLLVGGSKQT